MTDDTLKYTFPVHFLCLSLSSKVSVSTQVYTTKLYFWVSTFQRIYYLYLSLGSISLSLPSLLYFLIHSPKSVGRFFSQTAGMNGGRRWPIGAGIGVSPTANWPLLYAGVSQRQRTLNRGRTQPLSESIERFAGISPSDFFLSLFLFTFANDPVSLRTYNTQHSWQVSWLFCLIIMCFFEVELRYR